MTSARMNHPATNAKRVPHWQQNKEWPVEPTREKSYKRRIAQLEAENAALKEEVAEL